MDILSIFHIYVNIYIFIVIYESIDIGYNNKINFVLNVYTCYFKTKPQTLLKLTVCFPTSLYIVCLKWVIKLLKERGFVADCNLLYVLYQYLCREMYFVLMFVLVKEQW